MTALHERPDLRLGELGTRLRTVGLGVGVIALAIAVLWGWLGPMDSARFFRSWIVAFLFVLSLALGGLFFTFIQHLTRAGWSASVRRVAEAFAGNLQWLWILFVPVAVLMLTQAGKDLYHWADPEAMDPESGHYDAILAGKAAFLNKEFWFVRCIAYFVIWGLLARFFLRSSVAQDSTGDVTHTLRMQWAAPLTAILYAVTQSFAVIDWAMTLEAHWFSTIYGVYFFAASCCGFASLFIIAFWFLQRNGRVRNEVTLEHYQDLGKYLFAFGVVFWAYIAYSQYMLIWYGNIQEETTWFLIRQLGGWQGLSILLLVGHFLGPFLILMSRYPKRWKTYLAAVCVWMLFIHYIDMYWLAVPAYPAELVENVSSYRELVTEFETGTNPSWQAEYGLHFHVVDVCCLLGLAGIVVGMTALGVRSVSLIPLQDPRLDESLAFENF